MKLPNPPHLEILESAPETLRVAVDYYNEDHRKMLIVEKYPDKLQRIAGTTVDIPTADFLAYYQFWKQRQRPDLYSHLSVVKSRFLPDALAELNTLVTFKHGTIQSERNVVDGNTTQTGRIGEAVALCVLNQIHDTGPGDWRAFPENRSGVPAGLRPMDHWIQTASDGKIIIQVEAKASYLPEEITCVDARIKKHARSIADKKLTHFNVSESRSGLWKADLRYGAITAFGTSEGADAQCWLLDPPTEGGGDPATVRTISRLLYACNLLQMVAPRSDLTIALVNRLASLLSEEHLGNSDKRPLLRANGKPYSDLFEETAVDGDCTSRFFSTRTRVDEYPAGGIVIQVAKKEFYFIGVREDLIRDSVLQNFESIQDYSAKPRSFHATVNAVIPTGKAISMGLASERRASSGPNQYLSFSGRLFASSGGFVFGTIAPDN